MITREKIKEVAGKIPRTYVFIDAANLFYGGEKSLGWKVDYKKLFKYLGEKYGASKALYFGGVETHGFQYDYLAQETVPLGELETFFSATLIPSPTNLFPPSPVNFGRDFDKNHQLIPINLRFFSKSHLEIFEGLWEDFNWRWYKKQRRKI